MKLIKKIFLLICLSVATFASDTIDIINDFKATKQEIEDGAVVVKRSTSFILDENNHVSEKLYYLIAILDDKAAKDYSHIKTGFNAHYKDYSIDFARVISRDGKISNLKKNAINLKNSDDNMYNDIKIIEFSLPKIKINTFIEYQISFKTIKQIIQNNYSSTNYLMKFQSNGYRLDSIREQQVSIKVPKNQKIYYKFNNIKSKLDEEEINENIIYNWVFKDIKSIKIENLAYLSYDEIVPSYQISTIQDWSIINNYLYKKYDEKAYLTDELNNLSKKLIKGLNTDIDKIKAIYSYIQNNIKYIFANFGSGGYIPHDASLINENLYGDCKDQTILFITLLKSINITAYPVLLNTKEYKDLNENNIVSTSYFNHMIAYIPSEDIWVDNTGSKFMFPGVTADILNQSSIILKNKGFEFKKIDAKLNNEVVITRDFEIDENNYLISKINMKMSGAFNHYYKARHQQFSNRFEESFKTLLGQIFINTKIYEFEILNTNIIDKNVIVKFKAKSNEKINLKEKNNSILAYGGGMDALVNNFTVLLYLTDIDKTKYGFNMGYTSTIKNIINCVAPTSDSKPNFTKLPQTNDTKYFKSTFKQKNIGNKVKIKENYIIKSKGVKPQDYKQFYKNIKEIIPKSTWVLEYKYDQFYKKELELKQTDNLESKIKLAEVYLNKMQLEEAKDILDEYISLHTDNYKLNYVYGLILGFLGEDNMSDKYLLIAEKLKINQKDPNEN